MIINIIAVSKIREKYIREGIEEYLKRLTAYCTVKVKEVEAQKVKSSVTIEKLKELEAQKIEQFLSEGAYLIVLDETGWQFGNEQFADYLEERLFNVGRNQIDLVIGGANGLSAGIKQKADLVWSLSKLTFPHQLVRLILLEQLYRTFKIINKEPYHK